MPLSTRVDILCTLWMACVATGYSSRQPFRLDPGKEYIAEGVYAQKAIDEIGDPDQGKNGYPLQSSCERVVKTAWPGLAFDVADLHTAALCARVKRYPARPIFLVTRLLPVASKESGTAEPKKDAEAENIPKVSVAADKQRALLIEGPTVLTAPLWAPAGSTVRCKLVIDKEGRISELETGAQLCESVPWSQFRYSPQSRVATPSKWKPRWKCASIRESKSLDVLALILASREICGREPGVLRFVLPGARN